MHLHARHAYLDRAQTREQASPAQVQGWARWNYSFGQKSHLYVVTSINCALVQQVRFVDLVPQSLAYRVCQVFRWLYVKETGSALLVHRLQPYRSKKIVCDQQLDD